MRELVFVHYPARFNALFTVILLVLVGIKLECLFKTNYTTASFVTDWLIASDGLPPSSSTGIPLAFKTTFGVLRTFRYRFFLPFYEIILAVLTIMTTCCTKEQL